MEVVGNRLQGVDYTQTPNITAGAVIIPELIVIHFTAGSSASSSIAHLTKQGSQASAHLVIAQDGKITQLAGFNQRAWHAGRSEWEGRGDVNSFSIGIELDNPGRLTRAGDKYRAWYGGSFDADEVIHARHKNETEMSYWHIYPEPQLSACMECCESLVQAYDIANIVGHDDIAPGRKSDPGPAFPMDNFRSRLFGREGSTEPDNVVGHGLVQAELLNFRDGPDGNLNGPALTKGTEVQILERQGDWVKVDVVRKGWVSSHYIEEY